MIIVDLMKNDRRKGYMCHPKYLFKIGRLHIGFSWVKGAFKFSTWGSIYGKARWYVLWAFDIVILRVNINCYWVK